MPADELGAAELVGLLADPHRYFPAYQRLLTLGAAAADAARNGLRHPDAQVRMRCCQVLDHGLDEAAITALLGALDDPAAEVRLQALHALACDRCKDGACRPDAATTLPRAIPVLAHDPHPLVRAMAAELVGAGVHSHPSSVAALQRAAREDPSPAVRKKASWYAPGGAVYQRTRPRPQRVATGSPPAFVAEGTEFRQGWGRLTGRRSAPGGRPPRAGVRLGEAGYVEWVGGEAGWEGPRHRVQVRIGDMPVELHLADPGGGQAATLVRQRDGSSRPGPCSACSFHR
jgi:hypothetical protein